MLLWYGLAWVWYGLAGIALYSMACCASYGICYGLAGIAWYMVIAWQARHGALHSI